MVKQQELPIPRAVHPDRNAEQGGKSFYFFDLDENIFHIESAHYVFHKLTQEMREVPGKIFWEEFDNIGKKGFLADYEVRPDDLTGSFRRFRDMPDIETGKQPLLEDLSCAITVGEWMGPSWNQFHHAVLNQRPIALITARGHHPDTIKAGMSLFKEQGIIPNEPNYLAVLPVSHPEISKTLGGGSIPELKRKAIRYAVDLAFQNYGANEFHRFGMSDDDPKNVKKIIEEFITLKQEYPKNAFFIIETARGQVNKWEIFPDHAEKHILNPAEQLKLIE